MFSPRRPSWFTRRIEDVEYRWPHPKARPAVKWLDRSLYLPWLVGR